MQEEKWVMMEMIEHISALLLLWLYTFGLFRYDEAIEKLLTVLNTEDDISPFLLRIRADLCHCHSKVQCCSEIVEVVVIRVYYLYVCMLLGDSAPNSSRVLCMCCSLIAMEIK